MSTFKTPTKTAINRQIFNSKQNPVVEPCNQTHRQRITRGFNQTLVHLEKSRLPSTSTTRARIPQNARPSAACPSLGRRGNGNDDELVEIREKALVRVMETGRKKKRQKENEILKEKMMQQEKRSASQLKHSQKERQRAEIYSINRILKQRFDE